MKKARPGYRLSVIAGNDNGHILADLIIRQTRTLGVRIQRTDRITAGRSLSTTVLADETCKEKHCTYKGYDFSKPEYESLAAISRKKGCSVIDLMEEYIKQRK
jgi:hypothetical protein